MPTPPTSTAAIALFDLDGTLTDPAEGITASFRSGLEAVGIDPATAGPLERFIGPPLHDSYASFGLDGDGVEAAVAGYRERFGSGGMFENQVYEGVPELLEELQQRGWRLAVATSKPEHFAVPILNHFGLAAYFEVIAGATLDGSRRHKVDVIHHALRQLEPPDGARVVMIGDRNADIDGAKAAGVGSIGVVWGYGSMAELIAADPDALAAEPAELVELLGPPTR
jgi:phosphoglycolate phosphatase